VIGWGGRKVVRPSLGLALAAAAALLSACASTPPAAPPGVAAAPAAADSSFRAAATPPAPTAAAGIDSGPSAEALAVLARIPDPIAAGQRVPAPEPGELTAPPGEGSAPAEGAAAEGAPADSAPAGSPATPSEVPVPTPTAALGERPAAVPDSTGAMSAPPPAAAPAESTHKNPPAEIPAEPPHPVVAAPPPEGGVCWRVQVVASTNRRAVEEVRATAESVLLVPMVVEQEGGLLKARTRDCMDEAAAESLKQRARATGFPGAFRFAGRRP
jgi:hypothetical protein